jgi:Skp family chaperone for outer membrane proteins
MKYVAALICLLLASITAPAFAHEMTNDCAAQAAKIANTAERTAAEKKCLADVSAPANVEKAELHDKKEHCDTNAKNMKLDGKKKEKYLAHCYKETDFDKTNPHPKM